MAEAGEGQRAGASPGWPAAGGTGNAVGGPVSGVVIQAGVVSGGVHMAGGSRFAVPLPRQLPTGPARLVDRVSELSALDGLLASAVRDPLLVVITGAPGMGKTAAALWWLHARDGDFPDGQLHADLGGEAVADVLARWLRALGVPPEWIPAAEAELAALWRSVTADRKLALLAENAASVAGIRLLLPGAGPSVAVVTSRRRLPAAGGDGARFIHLGPLPAEAAVGLLGQIAGAGRVAAEHEAALRLVGYCGSIPLAVCAAAGQLALSAGERIADAAAGLDPLNAMDDGTDEETGMRASLDAAYAALGPDTARAYRLLGLHPGPDFTAGLAAAALGAGRAEARALLARLAAACLAEPAGQGRYRFHDLIRAHARALALHQEAGPDRSAVPARIVGWYLCNCAEAERLLQPYRHGLRRDAAPPPPEGPEVTAATALDWMEAQRHGLRAVVEAARDDFPAAAWQLADAMWPLFLYRGHSREQYQVSQAGLDAARRCGDAEGQARMLDRTGMAARQLGSPEEAARCFRQAHVLWRGLGDTRKATGTVRKLGWIAAERGDHAEAIRLYRQALDGYQDPGTASPREAALAMIDLGSALTAAGREAEAVPALREAARLLEDHPDPYNQARAQAALGRAQAARPGQALPLLNSALEVMTRLGAVPAQAEILETLALTAARAGDPGSARSRYQEALALLPPSHRRAPAIRRALDALPLPENDR